MIRTLQHRCRAGWGNACAMPPGWEHACKLHREHDLPAFLTFICAVVAHMHHSTSQHKNIAIGRSCIVIVICKCVFPCSSHSISRRFSFETLEGMQEDKQLMEAWLLSSSLYADKVRCSLPISCRQMDRYSPARRSSLASQYVESDAPLAGKLVSM